MECRGAPHSSPRIFIQGAPHSYLIRVQRRNARQWLQRMPWSPSLLSPYIYIESISLATMQPRVVSLLSNQLKPLTANSTSCQGPSSGSQLESPGGAPAGHGVQTDLATAAALLPQCHCADASARQLAAAAAFRTQSDTPSDGPVVPVIRRFLHLVSWGACWLVML